MGRTCLFTVLLDPEDAFKDMVEIVTTTHGTLNIDAYKLKFAFEPSDKDATWTEVFNGAHLVLKAFLSTLAWVTRIGVGYKPFDYVEFVDGRLGTVPVEFDEQSQPKVARRAYLSATQLLPLVLSDSTLL